MGGSESLQTWSNLGKQRLVISLDRFWWHNAPKPPFGQQPSPKPADTMTDNDTAEIIACSTIEKSAKNHPEKRQLFNCSISLPRYTFAGVLGPVMPLKAVFVRTKTLLAKIAPSFIFFILLFLD